MGKLHGEEVWAVLPVYRTRLLILGGFESYHWSIEAAMNAKYLDKVIVVTNDKEVEEIACDMGAEVVRMDVENEPEDVVSKAVHVVRAYSGKKPTIKVTLSADYPYRYDGLIDQCVMLSTVHGKVVTAACRTWAKCDSVMAKHEDKWRELSRQYVPTHRIVLEEPWSLKVTDEASLKVAEKRVQDVF